MKNLQMVTELICIHLSVSDEDAEKRAAFRASVEAPHAPAVSATPLVLAALFPVLVICVDLPALISEIRKRMVKNISRLCHTKSKTTKMHGEEHVEVLSHEADTTSHSTPSIDSL